MSQSTHTQLVVLGSGPGGYSAAFRAADLGMEVTLVERHGSLGGVCLNVGCIPSKALLHLAGTLEETEAATAQGLRFTPLALDLEAMRAFRDRAVDKLTAGIAGMCRSRGVRVIQGYGRFTGPNSLSINLPDGDLHNLSFDQAIIAAGSRSARLPSIPYDDPRVWDSTDAVALDRIPARLLVIGGGIIGLEMATVYRALGTEVTIVEYADQLIPTADKDLVGVYSRSNRSRFHIHLATRVIAVEPAEHALEVNMKTGDGELVRADFDAVLVAVGRQPNGDRIGADRAGVTVNQQGFIAVDAQQRTNAAHIFAIGDLVGQPMLAHKASHQGHVAAEVAAGRHSRFEPRAIPSIAYTHPEIAWTGLTEQEARARSLDYRTAAYPWSASGRALCAGHADGRTKLIYDPDTGALLGAGIVGVNAGELIGELSLAIEFGASVEDLALTIHAHPTLHETVGLAGELAAGTITDLPNPVAALRKKAS